MEIQQGQQPRVSLHEIEKAIKISYAQSILSTVYLTLVNGMFLVGFALKLGADNAQIGMMVTLPMFCVLMQMVSSALVERGVSRRMLATWSAAVCALCWSLVVAIPYVFKNETVACKVWILIGLIILINLFLHISNNSRSSWLADLIPARRLGEFFGRTTMYANVVSTIFAVAGGSFLDHAKHGSIDAFVWIFLTASFIGLINALLNLPQADVSLNKQEVGRKISDTLKETFANKDLMRVIAYALVWCMQAISAPFGSAYMLRDLHMSYVGVGILTAVTTAAVLLTSPFWGKMVNRYGCRPILIFTSIVLGIIPLMWIWITTAHRAYCIMGFANFIGGFALSGNTVALSTIIYNVTPKAGRSGQLALYSILVTLFAAPLPAIGGHLPDWLHSLGLNADLRCTFWASQLFIIISIFLARRIRENKSHHTKELVSNLPKHLVGVK